MGLLAAKYYVIRMILLSGRCDLQLSPASEQVGQNAAFKHLQANATGFKDTLHFGGSVKTFPAIFAPVCKVLCNPFSAPTESQRFFLSRVPSRTSKTARGRS